MNRDDKIKRLLHPQSIAFIGGRDLERPLKNLEDLGFTGDSYVINPKHSSILGKRCLATISALPDNIDAAFIAINAKLTINAVRELSKKGCHSVICYAAGFAEIGNAELQQRLLDAAGDMVLVGPNCYGLINYATGTALWPDILQHHSCQKGAAIISQSGNVALNISMQDRSVPISLVLSIGNQADLSTEDLIEYLCEDPAITAIGIYLEGIKDLRHFSQAAIKACDSQKPLVILKAGTSDLGAEIALSHTSSLTGSNALYQAMFDRLAIVRVTSESELLEALKLACLQPCPPKSTVGVLTCSGADSTLIADALDSANLSLPPLSTTQKNRLKPDLPYFVSLNNPLDYNTRIWGNFPTLSKVFTHFSDEKNYAIILLILDFPHHSIDDHQHWQTAVDAFIEAKLALQANSRKLFAVVSNLPELFPETARTKLLNAGIAPLQGMHDGISALRLLIKQAQRAKLIRETADKQHFWLKNPPDRLPSTRTLNEAEAKKMVADHGVPIPKGQLCTLEQLQASSASFPYPVSLKGVNEKLSHKTEMGGVVLNIANETTLLHAACDMVKRLMQLGITDIQFLIEPMITDSVGELIIGLKWDAQFGLALVIGSGGILVNLLNDCTTLLLPTDENEVRRALSSLKGYQLLTGFRNRPEGDIDATVNTVLQVAAFGMTHWQHITALDINPLMVRPKNQGVVTIDALIQWQQ